MKTLTKIKETILNICNALGDIVITIMPILLGVGMLRVVLVLIGPTVINLISLESDTYIVLNFVCDSGFYFLPIYIGFSAAERFNTNRYLGALIGAMLLHPTFVELIESGKELSVFGLNITANNYGNQMLPIILAVYLMSFVYGFLDKKLKDPIKTLVAPVATLLIMVPLTFCVIGPIGVVIGNGLVNLLDWISVNCGVFAHAIVATMIPLIVMFGLCGPMDSTLVMLLTVNGYDNMLFYSNILYNTALCFVVLAIYFRQKKKDSAMLAASITALGGVSEPAIFGYVIKDFKALISLMIGQFIGGLIAGIFKVKSFSIASFSVLGILATIGPNSSFIGALIALIVDSVIAFILSYILHKESD